MQCYFDYIHNPISPYRKKIFEKVIATIQGGDVLDLGCGQVGHYWAMGYALRAHSLTFSDYSPENIAAQSHHIALLTPDVLVEQFNDTLSYLTAIHCIPNSPTTPRDIATAILSNTKAITAFDFLRDSGPPQFDHILAIESLECVNSEQDLRVALRTAVHLLNPGGHLAVAVLRYDQVTETTETLVQERLGGLLNPSAEVFKRVLTQVPHRSHVIEMLTDIEIANYSSGYIAHVYV